jgi:hypothetical protein
MKYAILAATILITSIVTPVQAQISECPSYREMAYHIMELRQRNVPIREVLEAIERAERTVPQFGVHTVARTIATEAYTFPIIEDMRLRTNLVNDYARMVYTACIEVFSR